MKKEQQQKKKNKKKNETYIHVYCLLSIYSSTKAQECALVAHLYEFMPLTYVSFQICYNVSVVITK